MPVTSRAKPARRAATPPAQGVNGDAKDRVQGVGTDSQKIVAVVRSWLAQEHPTTGLDTLLTRPFEAIELGLTVARATGLLTPNLVDRMRRDLQRAKSGTGADVVAAINAVCRAAMCARKRGVLKSAKPTKGAQQA